MSSAEGYIILKQVVSLQSVQRLATDLERNPKITVQQESYIEYEVPQSGYDIRDEFFKNVNLERLLPLFPPNSAPKLPHSINVGKFHATNTDPTRLKTANKDEVYITIAVTDLGPDNGWFTFFEGSHQRQAPFTIKTALSLQAGDAVAWSGRIVYFHSSGGGGKFVTLVYRLTP